MNRRRGESHSWFALFLRLGALLAVAFALVLALRRRYITYAIAGDSMLPAFRDGDFVIARRLDSRSLPRVGDVVLAPDPRDPTRTLVKRVAAVDLHRYVTLVGDNPIASTDSRHFGPVPADTIIARVSGRYWPLFR